MFVGGETGLKLSRVSCFVGVEKMDQKPKLGPELDALIQACDVALQGVPETHGALA